MAGSSFDRELGHRLPSSHEDGSSSSVPAPEPAGLQLRHRRRSRRRGKPVAPARHPGKGARLGASGTPAARSAFRDEGGVVMADGSIVREDHGLVALLKLARPSRRNALSRALVAELSDALSAIETESMVRSVVLTGEGS